jgi:hypothetical protein
MGMRERGEERPVFAALCVEYGDDGVTKLKQFKQSFKSFFTFDIDRDWNLPELHKEEEEDDGRGGGGWHAGMGAKAGTGSGFLAQAFDENAAYDGGSGGGDYGGTVWDLKNKSAGGGGSGLEVDVGELDIGGGGGGGEGGGGGLSDADQALLSRAQALQASVIALINMANAMGKDAAEAGGKDALCVVAALGLSASTVAGFDHAYATGELDKAEDMLGAAKALLSARGGGRSKAGAAMSKSVSSLGSLTSTRGGMASHSSSPPVYGGGGGHQYGISDRGGGGSGLGGVAEEGDVEGGGGGHQYGISGRTPRRDPLVGGSSHEHLRTKRGESGEGERGGDGDGNGDSTTTTTTTPGGTVHHHHHHHHGAGSDGGGDGGRDGGGGGKGGAGEHHHHHHHHGGSDGGGDGDGADSGQKMSRSSSLSRMRELQKYVFSANEGQRGVACGVSVCRAGGVLVLVCVCVCVWLHT